ncbi:MAG: hypothetical protein KJO85_11110 [Gammaproteobacteria bacterium]|nr:hypothetical protein [Gammaproteobacteria bacterium]
MHKASGFVAKTCMLVALGLPLASQAGELVREFNGSRSTDTVEFEVRAPWILDWRMVTDYPGQMAVDISLVDARTGAFEGSVLKTKWPGNGVRLFHNSGRFQFKVISNLANWTLKVEQLTPEEAEQYTPRQR